MELCVTYFVFQIVRRLRRSTFNADGIFVTRRFFFGVGTYGRSVLVQRNRDNGHVALAQIYDVPTDSTALESGGGRAYVVDGVGGDATGGVVER